MKKKIVLLGAGSGFFRGAIGEIVVTEALADSEIVLYDIDKKTVKIMEAVARRMATEAATGMKVSSTAQLSRALDGADYALSSIGVHGPNNSYHKLDMDVAARFGIIQTTGDTVGPGGISHGLRIIPIYLKIARSMEKYCPNVVFLNHSNPMAQICRAINKYTQITCLGLCHGVQATIRYLAGVLDVPYEEVEFSIAGPNHMSWVMEIKYRGKDMYPTLKRRLPEREPEKGHIFANRLFSIFGIYPLNNDRHIIEFFPFLRETRTPEELPYQLEFRSDTLARRPTEKEAQKRLKRLADGKDPITLPMGLSPEATGRLMAAMAKGEEYVHIVNVPNQGAVPNLPDWAVIELKAALTSKGCRPIYVGPLPIVAARWALATIYQQELLVDAAVLGKRDLALLAMVSDPQIISLDEAEKVLDALVKAHGKRLARFAKRTRR
jgi:alpha-galactosidase